MKKTPDRIAPAPFTRRLRRATRAGLAGALVFVSATAFAAPEAQFPRYTWSANPISGIWQTPENWMPLGVPDTQEERAVFGPSAITDISGGVTVGGIEFLAGASQYTITGDFSFVRIGVLNESDVEQSLNGTFHFTKGASAESQVTFEGTFISFNSASAGSATYINNGLMRFDGFPREPFVTSADSSTIINNGQIFFHKADAGSATIINNGGATAGAEGGYIRLAKSGALSSTIICNGGQVPGAKGAHLFILHLSSADSATLIANGGTGPGSGGLIRIGGSNTTFGDIARIEVFGNGAFDISRMSVQSNSIGSLEGDGLVYLGATALEIGGNGFDTTFSGTISDEGGISDGTGGSIVKIGTETLVLAGDSTYTGGTTIETGSLFVNNATGSATGSGAVQANGGTLGGSGTVSGPITVGTNSGSGAVLDPGASAGATGVLSTLGSALFQSDATCHIDISSADGEADGLVADGVTISGAAQIVFTDLGSQTLPAGTVFTVIANTAATPIAGIFANLPDGSVVMVGSNAFLVNYEGGDGNDLTLTAE